MKTTYQITDTATGQRIEQNFGNAGREYLGRIYGNMLTRGTAVLLIVRKSGKKVWA